MNPATFSGRGVRGSEGARHPSASRGRQGWSPGEGGGGRAARRGAAGRGEGGGDSRPRGARLPAARLPGAFPGGSLE